MLIEMVQVATMLATRVPKTSRRVEVKQGASEKQKVCLQVEKLARVTNMETEPDYPGTFGTIIGESSALGVA